jgi:thiosulfate/3-mercaptopyruvate sulfurtransferase
MGPLVTPEELAVELGRPDLAVCDVRWYLSEPDRGRAEFELAHLPGSVFVDLETDLSGGPGGGRHPLPTVDDFAGRLSRWGIGPDDTVVAYDATGGAIAARLWWMLRSIGHDRAAVLDGGYAAWVAAGLPTTDDVPARPPAHHPSADRWRGVVDADDVAAAGRAGTDVVDARAAARYRGEDEPIDPRAGHVPGARNLFHLDNLGDDGRHLAPERLAERFADLGDAPIVYCGSGVTACHALLAMAVAGRDDGRLYPGSWSEWSGDPSRPLATGPDPG